MYRSIFLCFLELVVRGGLSIIIGALTEVRSHREQLSFLVLTRSRSPTFCKPQLAVSSRPSRATFSLRTALLRLPSVQSTALQRLSTSSSMFPSSPFLPSRVSTTSPFLRTSRMRSPSSMPLSLRSTRSGTPLTACEYFCDLVLIYSDPS
jgi:hypothetical protein